MRSRRVRYAVRFLCLDASHPLRILRRKMLPDILGCGHRREVLIQGRTGCGDFLPVLDFESRAILLHLDGIPAILFGLGDAMLECLTKLLLIDFLRDGSRLHRSVFGAATILEGRPGFGLRHVENSVQGFVSGIGLRSFSFE